VTLRSDAKMRTRRHGGLQRRLSVGLVAAASSLALCGGALAFAPGQVFSPLSCGPLTSSGVPRQATSAVGGAALQCAPASSSFFGTTVDAAVGGDPAPPQASGRSARQEAAGGVRHLCSLGGGSALKSTLRKYGLTAVVTHGVQWIAWMVLAFTALASVRAFPLKRLRLPQCEARRDNILQRTHFTENTFHREHILKTTHSIENKLYKASDSVCSETLGLRAC
jgi:hypothetical protein